MCEGVDFRRCDPQARSSTSFVNNTINLPQRNFLHICKYRVGDKVLIFGDIRISLQYTVGQMEGSSHARNQHQSFSRFDRTRVSIYRLVTDTNGQMGHGIYSDSTATRGKKRKTPIFSLLWRRMKSPVHRTWEVCFIVYLENFFSDSMNTSAAKVCRFGGKCNHRS